jgi:hypothetical protein
MYDVDNSTRVALTVTKTEAERLMKILGETKDGPQPVTISLNAIADKTNA